MLTQQKSVTREQKSQSMTSNRSSPCRLFPVVFWSLIEHFCTQSTFWVLRSLPACLFTYIFIQLLRHECPHAGIKIYFWQVCSRQRQMALGTYTTTSGREDTSFTGLHIQKAYTSLGTSSMQILLVLSRYKG